MTSPFWTELDLAALSANQTMANEPWTSARRPTRPAPTPEAATSKDEMRDPWPNPPTERTSRAVPASLFPQTPASLVPKPMPASLIPQPRASLVPQPSSSSVAPPSTHSDATSAPHAPASIAPRSMGLWPLTEARREIRAMIVDDDPTSLRAYQRILLKRGVVVTAASGPEEALHLLSAVGPEHRPDLLFLDVVIPRMNGAAFIDALRCVFGAVRVPVVLISALHVASVREYAQRWGADGFVLKAKGMIHLETAMDDWVRYVSVNAL